MTVEHHALVNDLPEYKDHIHALKLKSTHFSKLMDEYHALTSEIETSENNGGTVSDETGHTLKAKRVHLKDELMKMLDEEKGKGGSCCGGCGCH